MSKIRTVNISFPAELLSAIDIAAKQLYASRSEYIRHAVIQQMQTDSSAQYVRRRTPKNVPQWAIRPSNDDEYELAPEYK